MPRKHTSVQRACPSIACGLSVTGLGRLYLQPARRHLASDAAAPTLQICDVPNPAHEYEGSRWYHHERTHATAWKCSGCGSNRRPSLPAPRLSGVAGHSSAGVAKSSWVGHLHTCTAAPQSQACTITRWTNVASSAEEHPLGGATSASDMPARRTVARDTPPT